MTVWGGCPGTCFTLKYRTVWLTFVSGGMEYFGGRRDHFGFACRWREKLKCSRTCAEKFEVSP